MVEDRLSEAIAVQIAQLIMSGKLASGTKLKQTELADMLDVSMIPIREALQLLENQGLVKRLETRHIIVADINSELLDETFSVIKAVEKNAFYTIIKHDGWNNVWNCIADMADTQLHNMIINKSENLYIKTLLENSHRYYISYAQQLIGPNTSFITDSVKSKIYSHNENSDTISDEVWEKVSGILDTYYMKLCDAVVNEGKYKEIIQ